MAGIQYHYKTTKYKANFLTVVCFILFVLYSLMLYLKHQYGIVALTYFIESELTTSTILSSTTRISALLGTLLCVIPAIVLLHTLHFPLRFKALAFLPSYILLGFLTGISPETVASHENEVHILSPVLLLLLCVVLIFLSQVYREDRGEHAPVTNYLGLNILISVVGMLLCMALTNTNRQLHVQLALAEAIHRNDYSVVDNLSKGETTTNNTITSIQVLNLSKKGVLGEKLFSLPHLTGSQNMLPDTNPASLLYHTPTLVYGHLKAVPVGKKWKTTDFLEKALKRRMLLAAEHSAIKDTLTVRILADYYLCALLLDRDLNRFSRDLPKYYNAGSTLPRHYREALAICKSQECGEIPERTLYSDMDSIYLRYKLLHDSLLNAPAIQRKECSKAYAGSYWNYYFFVNEKQ